MRGGKYWEEEGKKCRICGIEDEIWEHIWECTGRGKERI